MTTATLAPLPPYPSSDAQSKLSASQFASLSQKISLTIQKTLDLPVQTVNSAATVAFVSSYARDVAQNILDALIWDADSKANPKVETSDARSIRARTFLLAERLASTGALDLIILLDLSIVYAPYRTRLRALLNNAFSNSALLLSSATTSAIPAFTSVLLSHANTGLHGLRKAARTILCFTRVGPPELLRAFAHSRDFVMALAQAYDAGLGAAANSYGRLYLPAAGAPLRQPDEWECLFLQTKADLLDTFHILFTALLDSLAALPAGTSRAAEAERAVDVVLALHALPPPARTDDLPPTAFLNRSLLADYHHAYDLSEMLARALRRAAADDARLDVFSAALRELEGDVGGGGPGPAAGAGPARRKDPGALTLLLGSGVQHGIDNVGRGVRTTGRAPLSGAAGATAAPSSSRAVDPRVEEVRAILPDYASEYVEALLRRAEYGSVESVVGALLEGTAPPQEAIQQQAEMEARTLQPRDEFKYTQDRRNVFDGEDMDVSRLRMGKKSDDATTVLRDRTFMEQMKIDILRRVEEPSDSEEEVDIFGFASDHAKRKGKTREVAFDDELDDINGVRVAGDGEESSADEGEEEGEGEEQEPSIESTLERAYIANPKVFERDAATRRSKERAVLRAQTGWVDEQIEGFKIMLERNPKMKDKVLQKHEFSGNKPLAGPVSSGPNSRSRTPDLQPARGRGGGERGGRGRGRGQGRGRGRGAGTGEGGSGSDRGGGGGDKAHDHAWKGKNKARQANHDRKRGHEKKMSKAGGLS